MTGQSALGTLYDGKFFRYLSLLMHLRWVNLMSNSTIEFRDGNNGAETVE